MLCALGLALVAATPAQLHPVGEPPPLAPGLYRAWLDSPGGELPFGLEIQRTTTGSFTAAVINGVERIQIPELEWLDAAEAEAEHPEWWLELRFPHYDSRLRARPSLEGALLDGEWTKTSSGGKQTRMPFHARFLGSKSASDFLPQRFAERPAPPGMTRPNLAERYAVKFESSKDMAIGVFQTKGDAEQKGARPVLGTFLTTTGDYRYLAGSVDALGLRLSCFDGAHAFLFHAKQVPGRQVHGGIATLAGDFWSRDTWHESWSAEPNAELELPDPWQQVDLKPHDQRPDWRKLKVHTLDGKEVELGSLAKPDQVTLLVLFGSWCPNCHDLHTFLKEVHAKYHGQGLQIISLGFELGGERTRDLAQLARYRDTMKLPWPIALAASSADKKNAAEAFPLLNEVKSYPTTLFVGWRGQVRRAYSGFSGPATGSAFERTQSEFHRWIRNLLTEE